MTRREFLQRIAAASTVLLLPPAPLSDAFLDAPVKNLTATDIEQANLLSVKSTQEALDLMFKDVYAESLDKLIPDGAMLKLVSES